jgi:hypothetical protein
MLEHKKRHKPVAYTTHRPRSSVAHTTHNGMGEVPYRMAPAGVPVLEGAHARVLRVLRACDAAGGPELPEQVMLVSAASQLPAPFCNGRRPPAALHSRLPVPPLKYHPPTALTKYWKGVTFRNIGPQQRTAPTLLMRPRCRAWRPPSAASSWTARWSAARLPCSTQRGASLQPWSASHRGRSSRWGGGGG